jgi:hypothetical protein
VKRILVDLRVLIAVLVALGATIAFLGLEVAAVYNAPVQHVTDFEGTISAKVVNYSTIVSRQNLTVNGVPAGALLGFNWTLSGPGGAAGIMAYAGPNPDLSGAGACIEAPQFYTEGSCSWVADGRSLTVTISEMTSAPPVTGANYTGYVFVQGWYAYTTAAI